MTKIILFLSITIGLTACLENIRPVKNPPATPARTNRNKRNPPPTECQNKISWNTIPERWKEQTNPKKKPTLPILEVECESTLDEIKIKIRSSKNWADFFNYRSTDGFAFGTIPIHLYFDKDFKEKWGLASAWQNEPEAAEKKEDDYYARIEMGYRYIPAPGKDPINKAGNIKLDSLKNNIIDPIITYSLRGRNSKGEWRKTPPPTAPGKINATFRDFTDHDTNTITIRIPHSLLNVENGDTLLIHGMLEKKSKDISLHEKCLRLGY